MRGFLARQQVKIRRAEARRQAQELEQLLNQIAALNISLSDFQSKIVTEDTRIPPSKCFVP